MTLTQTNLNNSIERCRILIKTKPQISSEVLVYINLFFTKIRTLQKLNEILKPVEIEIEAIDQGTFGIKFSWIKTTPRYPHKVDTLDIIFLNNNYFLLKGYYETIDLKIDSKIEYEKDFSERALVHLRHFTYLKKKK